MNNLTRATFGGQPREDEATHAGLGSCGKPRECARGAVAVGTGLDDAIIPFGRQICSRVGGHGLPRNAASQPCQRKSAFRAGAASCRGRGMSIVGPRFCADKGFAAWRFRPQGLPVQKTARLSMMPSSPCRLKALSFCCGVVDESYASRVHRKHHRGISARGSPALTSGRGRVAAAAGRVAGRAGGKGGGLLCG